MNEAGQLGAEHRPKPGNTGRIHRPERHSMIAVFSTDDFQFVRLTLAVPKETGCLDSTVVCVPSTGGEEKVVYRGVTQLRQFFCQLNCRNICVADIGSRKRQLLHLTHGSVCQLFSS